MKLRYLSVWYWGIRLAIREVKNHVVEGRVQNQQAATWRVVDHAPTQQVDEDNLLYGVIRPHTMNHAEVVELRRQSGYVPPEGDDAA